MEKISYLNSPASHLKRTEPSKIIIPTIKRVSGELYSSLTTKRAPNVAEANTRKNSLIRTKNIPPNPIEDIIIYPLNNLPLKK